MRPSPLPLALLLACAACSTPERDCAPVCAAVETCLSGTFARVQCESECLAIDAARVQECGECLQGADCAQTSAGVCDEACWGFAFARSCLVTWPIAGVTSQVQCHAQANGAYACACLRNGERIGGFASSLYCALPFADQQEQANAQCGLEWPGGGDLRLTWTFAGKTCAFVPEVKKVAISVTGPQGRLSTPAANDPCAGEGLTIPNPGGGEYRWELLGLDSAGNPLYRADGSVSLYTTRTVAADLQPVR